MDKIIEYTLETLNRDNGGAKFENLATDLADKEICSNIIPSTGPYGGGDKGVDAKTHTTFLTESSDTYRLFQSPKSTPINKRIIFAYSINKGWKNKLKKDIEKIVKTYKLKTKNIVFITNQFIKEKDKSNYLVDLKKEYPRLEIEIFDGSWLTQKLKDKHYYLMVKYFNFSETDNPEIVDMYKRIYSFREGGMTDKESIEVKEYLERAHYRTSYNGVYENRVLDLMKVANIQKKYTKFVDEAIKNYEEAFIELENVQDKSLGADLFYSYFQALQKARYFNKLASKMPDFRTYILTNNVIPYFKYLFSWSLYLLPHYKEIKSLDINQFINESFFEIEKYSLPSNLPKHIVAQFDEAIVYGKQTLKLTQNKELDIITLWSNHIDKYKDIPLYAIENIGKIVTGISMFFEGEPEYENLYSKVEEILQERNKKLGAAQLRKDRAFSLYNVGKYEQAIHHLNIVKLRWFDHETIRGSLLTSILLKECYTELNLKYAAIYELLTILHISTLDEQLFKSHRDLFVVALAQLYYKYLSLGLVATAVLWGKLTYFASLKYEIKPDGTPSNMNFGDILGGNSGVLLNDIRQDMPNLHQKIFNILEPLGLSAIEGYKMLVFETDEDFVKGWEGREEDLVSAKSLRKRMLNNEIPKSHTPGVDAIIDETEVNQSRVFKYKGVEYIIEFGNSYEEKLISEHIFSFIQSLILEIFLSNKLTWIEEKIIIRVNLIDTYERFVFQENANNEAVDITLKISKETIQGLYKSPFNYLGDFERVLLSGILTQTTIDNDKTITDYIEELAKNGFLEVLSSRLPFGMIVNTFFDKEEYEKIVNN